MKRRPLLLLSVALALGLAAAALRTPLRASPSAKPGAPAKGAAARAAEALPVEGYTVVPGSVRQSVPAVGTLVANEQVAIVSESSRRIAAIHFEEGALVAKGALLFKLDDADLRADRRRLLGRRALLSSTEARLRELAGERLVSQQDYDRAGSELLAIDGEIATLDVALAKTEIRAPFAGRLGLRRASLGAYISPNTALTTLQDLSQLKLDFTLPEKYAEQVRPGQPLSFRVEGRGEPFAARVVAVEPQIDPGTRSLLVRAVVPNPGTRLQPGASASVEIEVEAGDGILVPARALLPSIKGHSVFVLRDGHAVEQEVRIGLRTQDSVQILSGLAAGDTVLTSNLLRLRPGLAVRLTSRAD